MPFPNSHLDAARAQSIGRFRIIPPKYGAHRANAAQLAIRGPRLRVPAVLIRSAAIPRADGTLASPPYSPCVCGGAPRIGRPKSQKRPNVCRPPGERGAISESGAPLTRVGVTNSGRVYLATDRPFRKPVNSRHALWGGARRFPIQIPLFTSGSPTRRLPSSAY